MVRRPRGRFAAGLGSLLAVGLSLAGAGAASAATFYVDGASGNDGNNCTSPATACKTIVGGVIKAEGTAGPDTIQIAAGTYSESVVLFSPGDDGDTFVGAGSSPSGTIIQPPTNQVAITDNGAGGTFRHLRLRVPNGGNGLPFASNGTATSALTIDDVYDEMLDPADAGIAFFSSDHTATLDRLTVVSSSTANTAGLSFNYDGSASYPGSLTIRDSSITGAAAPSPSFVKLASVLIQRSRFAGPANGFGTPLELSTTNTTIEDSLVTGGLTGMVFEGGCTTCGTGTLHLNVQNTTIDAGQPGVNDPTDEGLHADASNQFDVSAALGSSILLEQQLATGVGGSGRFATVLCNDSDVPSQTQSSNGTTGDGTITCPSGSNGNTSSAPSQLFANGAGGDYHLKPGSPAVDTGSTVPLGAGESATDLDGALRVVDGDGDCTARRDKGAFEFSPPLNVSIGSPGGTAGTPIQFSGTACDPPSATLTYSWTFDDGGTATGQSVQHTFSIAGGHTTTLQVVSSTGRSGSASRIVTIAAPGTTTPSATKARLTGLAETNKTFAVGRASTPLTGRTAAKRHKRGAVFSFRLDQLATVKIAIQAKARGRRVGHRCRPDSRKLRHEPRCTRTITIATLTRTARAGLNRVAFSGRIRGRALKPGRYQAVFTAIDAAGASAPKTLRFRIVKR